MLHRILLGFFFVLTLQITIHGQVKTLHALKVSTPPKIDGNLNDAVWKDAPVASDFIESSPTFGIPAQEKTEVKIIYDNDAIYIGAHLYDDPKFIRRQLTLRDQEGGTNVDYFAVSFDTYHDKQNAFRFVVTSQNVQSDTRISAGNNFDQNWDAVWDSRIAIVKDGWTVEIRIPYMSLRFPKKDVQDWGMNFGRGIRRLNETSQWNPVNPKVDGFVNQFGTLTGLDNLTPPLRLSLLPYISTGYSSIPTNTGKVNTVLHNGGMDIKYGINQGFTLDMTLIPDFGQVQSDNVVLNLSPFEQQFNENRPFFTEGTELFNKAGLFYSRRVGKTPKYYDSANQLASDSGYTIVKNPSKTQLYNAVKFSGRTSSNLGIGVFNAVTAPEYAILRDSKGGEIKVQTEVLTNYNIIVLDQAFKNRSSLTFTNTNVIRAGGNRNANVSGLDLNLYNKTNTYNFQAKARLSDVTGLDKHTGFFGNVGFQKVSGNWQWGLFQNILSDKYDPNDLGFQRASNEVSTYISLNYYQFAPNKYFNSRSYNFNIYYHNIYNPSAFSELNFSGSFQHVFKNFWDVSLEFDGSPFNSYDYFETRVAGKKMKRLPWQFVGLFGSTDSRKKLFVSYGAGFANNIGYNYPFYLLTGSVRYRFNDHLSVSLNVRKEFDNGEFGWSHTDDSTGEPVIGQRHVERWNNILNVSYNFKARMSLTVRVRHFWSKVHYVQFFDVANDGSWLGYERKYEPDYDENYNAFNVDAFYTWDFKPGSRLVLSWKNQIGPDASIDVNKYVRYGENLQQTLSASLSNEVAMKLIYFIDYNRLRRKRRNV